jgi:3-hydroxy-3-methylglutaryl CoA synthase
MIGIESYGAYVPACRLKREVIAAAWGLPIMPGERSVARADEDSLTMAVEAGVDCLRGMDPKSVDGVFFASTTPPYREKGSASIIAAALDLRRDILTADFADSLKAGTTALRAANDAIAAGSARKVLVAASDVRMGEQESFQEMMFGDAAAALLMSKENLVAELKGYHSVSDDFVGPWRKESDPFVQFFEAKVENQWGHAANIVEALTGLVTKLGLKPQEIQKLAASYMEPQGLMGLAKRLGLDAFKQMVDPLFFTVGNTGTSMPLLLLVSALEGAKEGDNLVVAAHGDGADALLFNVTETRGALPSRRGVKGFLSRKMELPSYELYASFRRMTQKAREVGKASTVINLRDRKAVIGFYGHKCNKCGTVQYPLVRVCYKCHTKDDFQEIRLSRTGKVFTYTNDYLKAVGSEPTPYCVVEMDDGARVFLTMTDCPSEKVAMEMPVELTFRLMHQGSGFNNYGWKCRPVEM